MRLAQSLPRRLGRLAVARPALGVVLWLLVVPRNVPIYIDDNGAASALLEEVRGVARSCHVGSRASSNGFFTGGTKQISD